eukprot:1699716-Pyramimonas_sp.AAC.1
MPPGGNLAPKGRHAVKALGDDTGGQPTLPDCSRPSHTSLHPLQEDRIRALVGAPLGIESGTFGPVPGCGALEVYEEEWGLKLQNFLLTGGAVRISRSECVARNSGPFRRYCRAPTSSSNCLAHGFALLAIMPVGVKVLSSSKPSSEPNSTVRACLLSAGKRTRRCHCRNR